MRKREDSPESRSVGRSMPEILSQELLKLSDSDIVRIFKPEDGVWTTAELATELLTEPCMVLAESSLIQKDMSAADQFITRAVNAAAHFLEQAKSTPIETALDDSLLCSMLIAANSVVMLCPAAAFLDKRLCEVLTCPRASNRLLTIIECLLTANVRRSDSSDKALPLLQEFLSCKEFEHSFGEVFHDPRPFFQRSVEDNKGKVLIEDVSTTKEMRSGMSLGSVVASLLKRLTEKESYSPNDILILSARIRRACSAAGSVDDSRWFSLLFLHSFAAIGAPMPRWLSAQASTILLDSDPVVCSNGFLKQAFAKCQNLTTQEFITQMLRSFSVTTSSEGVSPVFRPWTLLTYFRFNQAMAMSTATFQSVFDMTTLLLSIKSSHYAETLCYLLKFIKKSFRGVQTSRENFVSLCSVMHKFMDPVIESLQRTESLIPLQSCIYIPVISSLLSLFNIIMRTAPSVSALMTQSDVVEKLFLPILRTHDPVPKWTCYTLEIFSSILNSDASLFSSLKAMGLLDAFANLFSGINSFVSEATLCSMPSIIQAISIQQEGRDFCERSSFVQQILDVAVSPRIITWHSPRAYTLGCRLAILLGTDSFQESIVNEMSSLLARLITDLDSLHCEYRDKRKFQEKYDAITDKKLRSHLQKCRLDEATGLHTHYTAWPKTLNVPCPQCQKLDEICGLPSLSPEDVVNNSDVLWTTRFSSFLVILSALITNSRGSLHQAMQNKGIFLTLLKMLERNDLPSITIITARDYQIVFHDIAARMQFSHLVDSFMRIMHSAPWNSKPSAKESVETHMHLFQRATILASTMSSVMMNAAGVNDSMFTPLCSGTGTQAFSDLCQIRQLFIAFAAADFPRPVSFDVTKTMLLRSVNSLRELFLSSFFQMINSEGIAKNLLTMIRASISSDVHSISTLQSRVEGTTVDVNKVLFEYVDTIVSDFSRVLFHNDTINFYVVESLRQGSVTRELFRIPLILFNVIRSNPELAEWVNKQGSGDIGLDRKPTGFLPILDILERLCDAKTIRSRCSRAGSTSFWSPSGVPAMIAQFHEEAQILRPFLSEPSVLFSLGPSIVQRILHVIVLSEVDDDQNENSDSSSDSSKRSSHQELDESVFEVLRECGFDRIRTQAAADLCHSSNPQEIAEYMFSHVEEVIIRESVLSAQKALEGQTVSKGVAIPAATEPVPPLVKSLLALRKESPPQYVKCIDESLTQICGKGSIMSVVASDILAGSDASDLKFQFLNMTLEEWKGSDADLIKFIRTNNVIPSLLSGLKNLVRSSTDTAVHSPTAAAAAASVTAAGAAAAAAAPETASSSKQIDLPSVPLTKCLLAVIKRDVGLNEISISDVDAAAAKLVSSEANPLAYGSGLLTPEERDTFISGICNVVLRADLSQEALVPFIRCLWLFAFDQRSATCMAKLLNPHNVLESFSRKNPPHPSVSEAIIEVMSSMTCNLLFHQAPRAEIEHMIRRFFVSGNSSVTTSSLINRCGLAACSHPNVFFDAMKRSVTVDPSSSVRAREKILRYSGTLSPVEEQELSKDCMTKLNQHVKDLVSTILYSSEVLPYFRVLLATSLLTSICVAHPSACVSLRNTLGPLTPEMLKKIFSALVASYNETPFSHTIRTVLGCLVQDPHDRDVIVNVVTSTFAQESEFVRLEDVTLLAALAQGLGDVTLEDDDTYIKNVSLLARSILDAHLPEILLKKLEHLRFVTFEERMFIPTVFNMIVVLTESVKCTEIPENQTLLQLSAILSSSVSRIRQWQPNEMKPDDVIVNICDHILQEQVNMSKRRLSSRTLPNSPRVRSSGFFDLNEDRYAFGDEEEEEEEDEEEDAGAQGYASTDDILRDLQRIGVIARGSGLREEEEVHGEGENDDDASQDGRMEEDDHDANEDDDEHPPDEDDDRMAESEEGDDDDDDDDDDEADDDGVRDDSEMDSGDDDDDRMDEPFPHGIGIFGGDDMMDDNVLVPSTYDSPGDRRIHFWRDLSFSSRNGRVLLNRAKSSKTDFCSFILCSDISFNVRNEVPEVFARALQLHVAAVEEAKRLEKQKKEEEERRRKEEEERLRREKEEQQKAESQTSTTEEHASAASAMSDEQIIANIGNYGIDRDAFNELPDEMKNEIISDIRQQIQQQQQQEASSEQPAMLDEAVLAELPAELREQAIQDFLEYNRRRSHQSEEEDINLTIQSLPASARRDALLAADPILLSRLNPELQEEAASLRQELHIRSDRLLSVFNLKNVPSKEKLMDIRGLSSIIRLLYLDDTDEFKRSQLIQLIHGFLAEEISNHELSCLLKDNLHRLLIPPSSEKKTECTSPFFDPFEEPYHPLVCVRASSKLPNLAEAPKGAAAAPVPPPPPPPPFAAAAAAAAEPVFDFVATKGTQCALNMPSHVEAIAHLALEFLNPHVQQTNDDRFAFSNFPEVLETLLRFASQVRKGSSFLSEAVACAEVNCKGVDFSKQPPPKKKLFVAACQLLSNHFDQQTCVRDIIARVCLTQSAKAMAIKQLQCTMNKLRTLTQEVVHLYVDRASSALQGLLDFAQDPRTSESAMTDNNLTLPDFPISKLQFSKEDARILEQFSEIGITIASVEELKTPDTEPGAPPVAAVAEEEKGDDDDDDADDGDSKMIDEEEIMDAMWADLDRLFTLLSSLKRAATTVEKKSLSSKLNQASKLICVSALNPLLPLVRVFFSLYAAMMKGSAPVRPQSSSSTTLNASGFFRTTSSGTLSASGSTDSSESSDKVQDFMSFCDRHKALLSEYVREKPGLLRKELQCLLKMPRVLDFDTKLGWFREELRRLHADSRMGRTSISVNRQRIFMDSFRQISGMRPEHLRGRLHVRFEGEEGVDAGGLTREWYHVISREMFNQDYALFTASDDSAFQPNPASSVNPDHLLFFKFIGRVVGKALWDGELLDAHFTRSFYKHILGLEVTFKDLEAMDSTLYRSLRMLLDEDMEDLTFVVNDLEFGRLRQIELKPGGADIPVTHENKLEYIRLYTQYKLSTSIHDQIDAFLRGFHDLIPADLIAPFTESELELLISGTPEIDVEDLRRNTEYHHYRPTSQQIIWFWRFVASLSRDEKAKLLQFVTGTGKVPLGGFAALPGMGGVRLFTISRCENPHSLPTAHTCFNQLDLPAYGSYEMLRDMMLLAINEGCGEFGFA